MKTLLIKILLIIMGIFYASNAVAAPIPWATGESRARDLQIMLVTFGVGDDIPSYWCHTALAVQDTARQVARIYNFGLYSFDQSFLMRFVSGKLIFSAGSSSLSFYLNFYSSINRDIRIVTLNLSPAKRLWLAKELERFILPENRDYLYDHYRDNCSTRLRDLIDKAVDGQLEQTTSGPGRMTLRDHTRRYTGRDPLLEILLIFMMSNTIDQPVTQWDEMFLPDELERYVLNLTYTDSTGNPRQLAESYNLYYQSGREPVPEHVLRHWPMLLMIGAGLGALAVLIAWRYRNSRQAWLRVALGSGYFLTGIVFGIPGLILALVSGFTQHTVTFHNENLLLANPLTLLFIPAGIMIARNSSRWLKLTAKLWYIHLFGLALAVMIRMAPGFYQENGLLLCLIAPLWMGMAFSVYLMPWNRP
jgi:hypothetical protein